MHLHFIGESVEHRPAAARTKMASLIGERLAPNGHRIFRKNRGGEKGCAVMLATIEAMAEADAMWGARGGEAHVTAQAAALDFTGHSSSSLFPTLGFGGAQI